MTALSVKSLHLENSQMKSSLLFEDFIHFSLFYQSFWLLFPSCWSMKINKLSYVLIFDSNGGIHAFSITKCIAGGDDPSGTLNLDFIFIVFNHILNVQNSPIKLRRYIDSTMANYSV